MLRFFSSKFPSHSFTKQTFEICPDFLRIKSALISAFTNNKDDSIASFLKSINKAENPGMMMRLINSGVGVRLFESYKNSGSSLCNQLAEKKLMPPHATYPGLGEAIQTTLDVKPQSNSNGLGR